MLSHPGVAQVVLLIIINAGYISSQKSGRRYEAKGTRGPSLKSLQRWDKSNITMGRKERQDDKMEDAQSDRRKFPYRDIEKVQKLEIRSSINTGNFVLYVYWLFRRDLPGVFLHLFTCGVLVVKSAWYLISLTLYDRKDFEGCEPWALSLSDAIP